MAGAKSSYPVGFNGLHREQGAQGLKTIKFSTSLKRIQDNNTRGENTGVGLCPSAERMLKSKLFQPKS